MYVLSLIDINSTFAGGFFPSSVTWASAHRRASLGTLPDHTMLDKTRSDFSAEIHQVLPSMFALLVVILTSKVPVKYKDRKA